MTLKGMNVMVGSVAQKSRQVQDLLCLLLAMRSWASHFPETQCLHLQNGDTNWLDCSQEKKVLP